MGRKRLDDSTRRCKNFTLRFNPSEYEELKVISQSLGVKPAKLLRRALENHISIHVFEKNK